MAQRKRNYRMASKRTRGWRASVVLVATVAAAGLLHVTALPGDGASSASPPPFRQAESAEGAPGALIESSTSQISDTVDPGSGGVIASAAQSSTDVSGATREVAPGSVSSAAYPSLVIETDSLPFTTSVNCGGYSCQLMTDIYIPTGPGPYPTLVLLRGGPGGIGARAYLDSFARSLAESGILVFNADYRDSPFAGGGYPQAFQDASCAVRFARAQAARFGGDGNIVTVAGHSLGGWVGSVIAIGSHDFTGNCLADGNGRPDAFVGLSGCYSLYSYEVGASVGVFFGNAPASSWAASDPLKVPLGRKIPIRLVAGTDDGTVYPSASAALDSRLLGAGWNVSLLMVPGGTHSSIMWTSYGGGGTGAIFSAIAAAQSAANATDPVKGAAGS